PVVEHTPVAWPGKPPFWTGPTVALGPPAGHVLTLLGINPGVDPDATCRRPVVLKGGEVGHQLAIGDGEPVDLFEDRLGGWLVLDAPMRVGVLREVIPGEMAQALVLGQGRVAIELLEPAPEVVAEQEVRPALTGWIARPGQTLQSSLGAAEAA